MKSKSTKCLLEGNGHCQNRIPRGHTVLLSSEEVARNSPGSFAVEGGHPTLHSDKPGVKQPLTFGAINIYVGVINQVVDMGVAKSTVLGPSHHVLEKTLRFHLHDEIVRKGFIARVVVLNKKIDQSPQVVEVQVGQQGILLLGVQNARFAKNDLIDHNGSHPVLESRVDAGEGIPSTQNFVGKNRARGLFIPNGQPVSQPCLNPFPPSDGIGWVRGVRPIGIQKSLSEKLGVVDVGEDLGSSIGGGWGNVGTTVD